MVSMSCQWLRCVADRTTQWEDAKQTARLPNLPSRPYLTTDTGNRELSSGN
jgi:hypothetical protein